MKIVLIGGHLSPALSVIDELGKTSQILFIGRKYALEGDEAFSLEYKTITNLRIPFVSITAGRLQRKLTRHTVFSLLKFPVGVVQSFFILKKFKPDVVLGFGGYVSLPVAISAFLLGIPVVIHEQTLESGFANKIIAPFAKKICISFESSRKFFPKEKTVFTGNPVRKFEDLNLEFGTWKNPNLPTVYITGGSLGSHFINTLVEGCLEKLLEKFNVVYQTGDAREFNDFDKLQKLLESLPKHLGKYTLRKFIDPSEVGYFLKNCDFVIGRAGINTVTELIFFEKPALLIPIPFSQNNEQLKNALYLEKLGLGKVLSQNKTDSKKLFEETVLMSANLKNYKINNTSVLFKDAQKNIVDVLKYVAQKKT